MCFEVIRQISGGDTTKLVGLDILDGLEEGLVKKGYEFTLLDETEIGKLISQLKHVTFQGKSSADENDDKDWINEVRPLVFRHTAKLKSIERQQTYVEDRIDFLLTEITRMRERINRLESLGQR